MAPHLAWGLEIRRLPGQGRSLRAHGVAPEADQEPLRRASAWTTGAGHAGSSNGGSDRLVSAANITAGERRG
jgi:hypothetical protein